MAESPWGGRAVALDGLRGLAVAAVLVYHLDVAWLPGGFLGVSLFFTLSGYLITTLLLAEIERTGTVRVGAFWARRARRLLPASLGALVLAVVVAATVADAGPVRSLPGDVAASLAEVANWRFVATHTAYGAGYEAPSLVQHFWSLAIEEQFYLLFPLLALRLGARSPLRIAVGIGIAASVAASVVLHDPIDPARTYFGTDTRAAEILVGALLATVLRPDAARRTSAAVAAGGVAAAAGFAVLLATAQPDDSWLHLGGFTGVALLSGALVRAALAPGPIATALAVRPLVVAGTISYGLYVYHWPIFQAISEEHTGLRGVSLALARLAPTIALALASHRWLEAPIRHHGAPAGARRIAIAGVGVAMLVLGSSLVVAPLADDRAVAATPAVTLAVPTTTTQVLAAPLPPPRRVLVVGDSLLHQGLPTLRDRFSTAGVELEALGGPGQSLLFDQGAWRDDVAGAVASFDPDLVVLESCCGFGSARLDESYVLPDGTQAVPDVEPTWLAWSQQAAAVASAARSGGAATLWVLAPPAQTNGYYGPVEDRIDLANDRARELARCRGDLGLVDWGLLAAPDGSFASHLPDDRGELVKVRADDGLHFTLAGQALLADLTVQGALAHWRGVGGRVAPTDAAERCGGSSIGPPTTTVVPSPPTPMTVGSSTTSPQ